MRYEYFLNLQTIEEIKTKYKSLAKSLHPDNILTGSHERFIAMKNEFDYILEGNSVFPIYNIPVSSTGRLVDYEYDGMSKPTSYYNGRTKHKEEETVTHLSPEEIYKQKATTFFNNLRVGDIIFDQIDSIIEEGKQEHTNKFWIYQEVQKLDDLTVDHFKYLTFSLGDPISTGTVFFKKYQHSKVI